MKQFHKQIYKVECFLSIKTEIIKYSSEESSANTLFTAYDLELSNRGRLISASAASSLSRNTSCLRCIVGLSEIYESQGKAFPAENQYSMH